MRRRMDACIAGRGFKVRRNDMRRLVFGGKKQVSMFEMAKLVSGHVK